MVRFMIASEMIVAMRAIVSRWTAGDQLRGAPWFLGLGG